MVSNIATDSYNELIEKYNHVQDALFSDTLYSGNAANLAGQDAGALAVLVLETYTGVKSATVVAHGVSDIAKNTVKRIDNAVTHSVDDALDIKLNPLDGTEADNPYKNLSGDETRDVYDGDWIKSIDINVKPTEANARRVSEERAQYKRDARELMKDEDAAKELDIKYPVQDFEYYKQKYEKEGFQGEALWEKIITQGKVTNKEYNDMYGKNKK